MIKADLTEAKIEYKDDADRTVDFHALRHTYITNVVKGGASPKIAQALARHSKITLTMDTYTHISLHDQRGALDALPVVPLGDDCQREKYALPKTGTDDQPVGIDPIAYKKLAKKSDLGLNQSSSIGTVGKAKQSSVGVQGHTGKPLEMVQLGHKKNPLSSSDNSGLCIEAEGTRTLNLRIDSPML